MDADSKQSQEMPQSIVLRLPDGQEHIELLDTSGEVLAELHDKQTRAHIESGEIDLSKSELTKVIWEYWKAGFERSYHGPAAIVDLGKID